jgi:hypothetical protein
MMKGLATHAFHFLSLSHLSAGGCPRNSNAHTRANSHHITQHVLLLSPHRLICALVSLVYSTSLLDNGPSILSCVNTINYYERHFTGRSRRRAFAFEHSSSSTCKKGCTSCSDWAGYPEEECGSPCQTRPAKESRNCQRNISQ